LLKTKNVTLTAYGNTKYLIPSLEESIGFHLLIDGVYEKEVLKIIIKKLSPEDIFIDIGANIGAFSIMIAKRLSPGGKVIAVEPSKRIIPYLKHNIEENRLKNIKLLEYAVTDQNNSSITFYDAPLEKFGMGSVFQTFHDNPDFVKTRTLDSIIEEDGVGNIKLIKVDVEGCEALVFKGGAHILSSIKAPIIIFEFCDWAEERAPGYKPGDAQAILNKYGYRIWKVSDIARGRRKPLTDIITKGYEMLLAAKDASSVFS